MNSQIIGNLLAAFVIGDVGLTVFFVVDSLIAFGGFLILLFLPKSTPDKSYVALTSTPKPNTIPIFHMF